MKSVKRFSALLLSIIMALSLISVSAADVEVKIIKEVTPETMDWSAQEVASIDFGNLAIEDYYDASVLNGSIEGNGLTVITNVDNQSQRAANRFADGYMLLGKAARYNTLTSSGVNQGRIYVRLDAPKEEKANRPYAVKIEYLAKADKTAPDEHFNISADNNAYSKTSWLSVVYNNTSNKNTAETPHNVVGESFNSGNIQTAYFLISDANFQQNVSDQMGDNHADFKINTNTGDTQFKIKSISVVPYKPFTVPKLKEVKKGGTPIASIDFGNLAIEDYYDASVLNGSIEGNGLTVITNVDNQSQRAANRFADGYMLLGKAARYNTLTSSGVNQGRIYVRLDAPKEEKANRPYAVKIEYLAKADKTVSDEHFNISADNNAYSKTSWLSVVYNNTSNKNTAETPHNVVGESFNSGNIQTAYFLISDANFQQNVSDQMGDNHADFKINTNTSDTQFKIKSISVASYDGSSPVTDPESLFAEYSEGPIAEDTALINADTGEYAGLSYQSGTPVVKVIDKNSAEHFAAMPVYDANSLGTFGIKISDAYVKTAEHAELTVSYWDLGTGTFQVEYNTADSAYTRTETVSLGNTGELVTYTFKLENTVFEGKQTGGYDFKLLTYQPDLCIDKVILKAVANEPVIEAGDINGDLKIDGTDLVMLRKHLLGVSSFENTDANSDGVTDIRDLVNLKVRIAAAFN